MKKDYRPRLSIDISPELKRKVDKYIQWGLLSVIMRLLISDLIDLIEKYGPGLVIGHFINRDITVEDFCKLGDNDGRFKKP